MQTRRLKREADQLEKSIEQWLRHLTKKLPIADPRIQEAIGDPYIWATQHTKTYNPHWVEEGRLCPYEPFPSVLTHPHLCVLFRLLDRERILWIEKSRDMMISWGCVAYLTLQTMIVPPAGSAVPDPEKGQSRTARQVREVPLSPPAPVAARGFPLVEAD